LHLYCLQVPIPKVPTIIVAALSIPDNLTAAKLFEYSQEILMGLLAQKVCVASYAADGSTVEQAIQTLIQEGATRTEEIRIKHPADDGTVHHDIVVPIYYFGSQPIAILQDPKHLLKTFCNNVFSGAQVPILPNHPILCSDIRAMAMSDSPIYKRDVVNVNRQDNNAATRLFSGATLKWLLSHCPELRGLIIFLFICGEMIDAYQSCTLSIDERVQMILRAQFFFEFWEKFIKVGGYSKAKHFISPQCANIVKILISGFLQLVVIYCIYGGKYALLPWLLCTEAVEHVFGMCQQIVKDFTMHDFHLVVPKLFLKLREAFFQAHTSDGKAHASGYSHTHTNFCDINLGALSSFPTNDQLNEASARAYSEAQLIFAYLGLTPKQLCGSVMRLPTIASWYADEDPEDKSDSDTDSVLNTNKDNDPTNYQVLIDKADCQLPQLNDKAITEAFSDDASHISTVLTSIGKSLAKSLPPVNVNERANAFELDAAVDLSELVRLRFLHQTKHAASGICTIGTAVDPSSTSVLSKPLSKCQKILREFTQIIKKQEDQGVGTGLENSPNPTSKNGNSVNAAAALKANATKQLLRRRKIFKEAGLPEPVWDACINSINCLHTAEFDAAGYGFAVSSNKNLGLILFLTIYSKGGGNHGKHGWVKHVASITAASNIVIQVYQHHFGTKF
ncbi:hypothetical protein B0H34DRAFT_633518, partial [Crassisporium funariophilum]